MTAPQHTNVFVVVRGGGGYPVLGVGSSIFRGAGARNDGGARREGVGARTASVTPTARAVTGEVLEAREEGGELVCALRLRAVGRHPSRVFAM